MTRILADIPDDDLEKLDALAAREKRSRASAIREAVRLYLVQHEGDSDWIERGFGYWAHRDDIGDGVEYQRAMREDRRPYHDI
ncbi:CopG family ribbon-helix-helix protein [Novosphingobium olei]|uniref:CopG family ribbon-helix-helix protein n=1 Tax=Novosphingobium olei TaxID=2728851 RepID=UPI00308A874D|nr:ribbon-helix-helix protein, CopG family [Novosphingobium olei]